MPAVVFEPAIALGFLLAATLTRLPVFWRSVLDWDESLYFLMAVQWRAGHLPYTTIWDNKPVGIYAIFAVAQAAFGDRVAAMRLAGAAAAALAAYAVSRITRQLAPAGGRPAALFAGLLYLTGSLSNDGLAANTEPFMACCTALAVWTAGAPRSARWRHGQALLTGLLLGAAFMIKYVAVFEAPAVFLLLLSRHRGAAWRNLAGPALLCIAGAALPLAATVLLYWRHGDLPLWWSASVVSNFRRVGGAVPPGALRYAATIELQRWGPLFAVALAMLAAAARRLARRQFDDAAVPFLAAWLLGGCLGVAAAKSFYDHYFLQILPVLCVTAGWGLGWLAVASPPRRRRLFASLAAIALLTAPAWAAAAALRAAAAPVLAWNGGPRFRPDPTSALARDLATQLAATPGQVYVFDGQPIIYGLIRQTPPTRYVFPSVLTTPFLAHVAGVDAPAELARILATRPLFIIRSRWPRTDPNIIDPQIYAQLNAGLAAHYTLWRRYPDADLYQRR